MSTQDLVRRHEPPAPEPGVGRAETDDCIEVSVRLDDGHAVFEIVLPAVSGAAG